MPDSDGRPWAARPRVALSLDDDPVARFDDLPPLLVAASRELLDAMLTDLAGAAGVAELVDARTGGRFRGEAEALATRLGTDWQSLMLANVCYDFVLSSLACSAAAIATPDGPVLFRNMDWWPEDLLARGSCVLECRRSGRAAFESAGWVAASGAVTGLSHGSRPGRGFAVALNAVSGPEGTDLEGYPVLLHLRTVLEDAEDFDDAVRMLSEAHLVSPALFLVVGCDNDQRIVIERTPTRAATRGPSGDAPLISTNDYRALFAPNAAGEEAGQLLRTACGRFDALSALARESLSVRPSDEELLTALTHPDVAMNITAQHVIARPRSGALALFVPSRFVREGDRS